MSKQFIKIAAVLFAAIDMVAAHAAITPPQIGFVQDSANALRPVLGIAGNFLLGDAAQIGMISAAFSGTQGMSKTDSSILITDSQGQVVASADAPSGSALFAFSPSGAPAFFYLVDANAWMTWDGQSFQSANFDLSAFAPATVVSVTSPREGEASVIIQRDDGLWDLRFALLTGELTSQTPIPGVTAPMIALATGEIVYRDSDGLVIRKTDGSEVHVAGALPANTSFQQMGKGWIQIRDGGSSDQYAARIAENREQIFALPGVDQ